MKFSRILQTIVVLSFFIGGITSVLAAGSASISASPSSGSKTVNQEFDVSIRVSGSTNFTTFKANVSLTNLTVVSFTLNASNVLWISQPSAGSLNFNGAVKGASGVSSLTVYTIRVKAPSAGTASIHISSGRVVGTSPVEDLSVGVTSGSYSIAAPAPTATRRPQPTSPPTTAAPTATINLTITPSTTEQPTPTPTLTPGQLTLIQILDPDSLPLVNTQVYIDGISYNTDNIGNIQIPGLTPGSHEVKFNIGSTEYKQSFIMGSYTGGQDFVLQIIKAQPVNANSLPIIYLILIFATLVILNILCLYLLYKKKKTTPVPASKD